MLVFLYVSPSRACTRPLVGSLCPQRRKLKGFALLGDPDDMTDCFRCGAHGNKPRLPGARWSDVELAPLVAFQQCSRPAQLDPRIRTSGVANLCHLGVGCMDAHWCRAILRVQQGSGMRTPILRRAASTGSILLPGHSKKPERCRRQCVASHRTNAVRRLQHIGPPDRSMTARRGVRWCPEREHPAAATCRCVVARHPAHAFVASTML